MAICHVDILLAFGRDELLCLKGMCALHDVLLVGQVHPKDGGLVKYNPVASHGEATSYRILLKRRISQMWQKLVKEDFAQGTF